MAKRGPLACSVARVSTVVSLVVVAIPLIALLLCLLLCLNLPLLAFGMDAALDFGP